MIQKRIEYQVKSLPSSLRKMISCLGPSTATFEILYRHWLRANQELLQGVLEVIDERLAQLKKADQPDRRKGKEKVKVQ